MVPPPNPPTTTYRVGFALVALGALATIVTLVPLATGGEPLPLAFYLVAMLAPVGLAVLFLGLWRSSRRRRAYLSARSGTLT